MKKTTLHVITVFLAAGCLASCSKNTGVSAGIPLIKPPVMESTPSGLTSTRAQALERSASISAPNLATSGLDTGELKSRFFTTGPTAIQNLLDSVDTRLNEINTRSAEGDPKACLSATPVEQAISVLGTSQSAYFQCYDVFGDGTGGMLFGKKDDTWYIYQNVGAGRSLAKVTPDASGAAGKYVVEAWFSVGQSNTSGCSATWHGCSYGVIHLKANSATKKLEMVVSGTGFGYCGAHLNTDGTNFHFEGAAGGLAMDGSAWQCSASDTACTLASDLSQTGSCASLTETSFELTSIGADAAYGSEIVTLNGTSSDAVHFGPEVSGLSAIAGVSHF